MAAQHPQTARSASRRIRATGRRGITPTSVITGTGRFKIPDPYQASGVPANPQSWNRYAYAGNDPENAYDLMGLMCVPLASLVGEFPIWGEGYGCVIASDSDRLIGRGGSGGSGDGGGPTLYIPWWLILARTLCPDA